MQNNRPHIPVLLNEVLETLNVESDGVYIDGTFGAGGYSTAILDKANNTTVYGIDRDVNAINTAKEISLEYPNCLIPVRGCFGDMYDLIDSKCPDGVDGIVLDIGVSSMQIDNRERGFSFQSDGPLDMRMDTETGQNAADVINNYSEEDIANILYKYGEERLSRRIARRIVEHRIKKEITTTGELAHIIHKALPAKKKDRIDPATRSFQALRIYVNNELDELERGLEGAEKLLKPNGRLVVVTFHSLEERIVKRFFRNRAGLDARTSRHAPDVLMGVPDNMIKGNQSFKLENKKAILPTEEEISINSRSRSARLRWGIKL